MDRARDAAKLTAPVTSTNTTSYCDLKFCISAELDSFSVAREIPSVCQSVLSVNKSMNQINTSKLNSEWVKFSLLT